MTQPMAGDRRWDPFHWGVAALALGGVILVLVATRRFGAGLSPDSGEYLACARNVMAGAGYRGMAGTPFTSWPPLFPSLLALLGWLGVDLLEGARWLNAVVFGLTVFTSGHIYLLSLRSRALAVLGTLMTFGFVLVRDASLVWTEPLFILLTLWFLLALSDLIERPSPRKWLWLVLLGALACLQRYAGVGLVASGGLVIALGWRGGKSPWVTASSLWSRLAVAAAFGVAACAPLGLWLVRNYLRTGEWAGSGRSASTSPMTASLVATVSLVLRWLGPLIVPVLLGAALLLVTAGLAAWRGGGPRRDSVDSTEGPDERRRNVGAAQAWRMHVAFLAVFLAFTWYSRLKGAMDSMDDRLVSPIYVPTMVVAFTLMDRGLDWTAKRLAQQPARRAWLVRAVIVALIGLAAVWPLRRTMVYAATGVNSGIGIYEQSPIMVWLRDHEPSGVLYANDQMPPCLLLRRPVGKVPAVEARVLGFLQRLSPEAESYLLWYNPSRLRPRSVLDAFVASGRAHLIQETLDGSVYRIE